MSTGATRNISGESLMRHDDGAEEHTKDIVRELVEIVWPLIHVKPGRSYRIFLDITERDETDERTPR